LKQSKAQILIGMACLSLLVLAPLILSSKKRSRKPLRAPANSGETLTRRNFQAANPYGKCSVEKVSEFNKTFEAVSYWAVNADACALGLGSRAGEKFETEEKNDIVAPDEEGFVEKCTGIVGGTKILLSRILKNPYFSPEVKTALMKAHAKRSLQIKSRTHPMKFKTRSDRLKLIDMVSKVDYEEQTRKIIDGNPLDFKNQIRLINFVKGVNGIASPKALAGAAVVTNSVALGASFLGPAFYTYESVACSGVGYIEYTKVVDEATGLETGECEIDASKLHKAMADLLNKPERLKQEIEDNPHLCKYLENVTVTVFNTIDGILGEALAFDDIRLHPSEPIWCDAEPSYTLQIKQGDQTHQIQVMQKDANTADEQLLISSLDGSAGFSSIAIPTVDQRWSGQNFQVTRPGESERAIERDRIKANTAEAIDIRDYRFGRAVLGLHGKVFRPVNKACCDRYEEETATSPDLTKCPLIGVQRPRVQQSPATGR